MTTVIEQQQVAAASPHFTEPERILILPSPWREHGAGRPVNSQPRRLPLRNAGVSPARSGSVPLPVRGSAKRRSWEGGWRAPPHRQDTRLQMPHQIIDADYPEVAFDRGEMMNSHYGAQGGSECSAREGERVLDLVSSLLEVVVEFLMSF